MKVVFILQKKYLINIIFDFFNYRYSQFLNIFMINPIKIELKIKIIIIRLITLIIIYYGCNNQKGAY
jgi:hypothetical protein